MDDSKLTPEQIKAERERAARLLGFDTATTPLPEREPLSEAKPEQAPSVAVRTKFWLSEKRPAVGIDNDEAVTLMLYAVYDAVDPQSENGRFWKMTPSGHIQLFTVNAAAAEQFEIGKQYYVTFEKAE